MTLTEDVGTIEEATPATATAQPKDRRWLFWTPLAVSIVLIVGLIVGMFVPLPILGGKAQSELSAQQEARNEICAYAPILATYNYRNLNDYYGKVLSRASGDFKSQFLKGQSELGNWLKQGEVSSKATGTTCGVDTSTGHLRIVIGISQSIMSIATNGSSMQTTLSVVATVEKQDGKWMVTKVDGPLVK